MDFVEGKEVEAQRFYVSFVSSVQLPTTNHLIAWKIVVPMWVVKDGGDGTEIIKSVFCKSKEIFNCHN